ncbi:hypothetical protein [Caloramator sp. Dgby_cultured_2]|uniref:hypothetical protein n=1 Tax=Caloramator sp. Dgby_cultured_2 TaxID=3029174 RepID=UPI003158823A
MDKRNIIKWLIYAALTLLATACLLPFAMMIINSTRSNTEIVRGFTLIPGKSLIENYKNMMYHMDVSDGIFKGIWLGYKNSFIIASSVTILSAYFSALTAYGFYAYEFKGKKLLFIIILIMMMIPSQLSLLGFFELNKALKTLDSYIPLIVPSIATPFTVFLCVNI